MKHKIIKNETLKLAAGIHSDIFLPNSPRVSIKDKLTITLNNRSLTEHPSFNLQINLAHASGWELTVLNKTINSAMQIVQINDSLPLFSVDYSGQEIGYVTFVADKNVVLVVSFDGGEHDSSIGKISPDFHVELERMKKNMFSENEQKTFLLSYDKAAQGIDFPSPVAKKQVCSFIVGNGGTIIDSDTIESTVSFKSHFDIDYWKTQASTANLLLRISVILIQGFSGNSKDIFVQKSKFDK